MYHRTLKRARENATTIFLVVLGVFVALSYFATANAGFVSHELQFTDASHQGLAIVPASCPSEPHPSGECAAAACTITSSSDSVESGDLITLNWNVTRTGDGWEYYAQPDRFRLVGTISPDVVTYQPRREQTGTVNTRAPTVTSPQDISYDFSGRTYYYWPAVGGEMIMKPFQCAVSVHVDPETPSGKCTGKQNYANASWCPNDNIDVTVDTPTSLIETCSAKKCEFKCEPGYHLDGGKCVPDDPGGAACEGTVPAHSTICTDDANVTEDTQRTLVSACSVPTGSKPKCQYICDAGWHEEGGICVEDNGRCLGDGFAHSTICTNDDKNVTGDVDRTLVETCTTLKKCEHRCDAGYHLEGGECVDNDEYACTGPTPSFSRMCTGDAENLTFNVNRHLVPFCSALALAGTYKCEFVCIDGMHYDPDTQTCVGEPPLGDASLYIEVVPSLVRKEEKSTVRWSYSYMQRCEVIGSNLQKFGPYFDHTMTTTTKDTLKIERSTTYTMNCTDLEGNSRSVKATIGIIPDWIEQ